MWAAGSLRTPSLKDSSRMRRASLRSFRRLRTARAWPMAAGLSREASMRLRSACDRPRVWPLAAASASSVELASRSLGDRRAHTRAASRAPGRLPPASWNSSARRARRGRRCRAPGRPWWWRPCRTCRAGRRSRTRALYRRCRRSATHRATGRPAGGSLRFPPGGSGAMRGPVASRVRPSAAWASVDARASANAAIPIFICLIDDFTRPVRLMAQSSNTNC